MGCYHSNCDYFFLASLSLFVRGGGFFGVGGFSFCSGQSSFLFTHAFVLAISTTPKLFPSPRIDHDLVKMLVIQTGTIINTHHKKPQVSAKMILHPSHQYHNTTTTTTTTTTTSPRHTYKILFKKSACAVSSNNVNVIPFINFCASMMKLSKVLFCCVMNTSTKSSKLPKNSWCKLVHSNLLR